MILNFRKNSITETKSYGTHPMPTAMCFLEEGSLLSFDLRLDQSSRKF